MATDHRREHQGTRHRTRRGELVIVRRSPIRRLQRPVGELGLPLRPPLRRRHQMVLSADKSRIRRSGLVRHGVQPVTGNTDVVAVCPVPGGRTHGAHRGRTDIRRTAVDLQDHARRVAERHQAVVAVAVGVQRLRVARVEHGVRGHEPSGQRVVVPSTDMGDPGRVLVPAEETVLVRHPESTPEKACTNHSVMPLGTSDR